MTRLHTYMFAVIALLCAACLPTGAGAFRSPVGTPTPTRADETVIPFEFLAANQILEIPLEFGGAPQVYTYFTPPVEAEVWESVQDNPPLYLITALEDLAPIQVWIAPEIQPLLTDTDFTQQGVFVFFPQSCGGGYIQRIATSQPGRLTVYAIKRTCVMTTADMKRPYQVVRFERVDVPFDITSNTQVELDVTVR